jgi:hypothetical protein
VAELSDYVEDRADNTLVKDWLPKAVNGNDTYPSTKEIIETAVLRTVVADIALDDDRRVSREGIADWGFDQETSG